jgi:hypothetical protein
MAGKTENQTNLDVDQELVVTAIPGKLTTTGLELPGKLAYEAWRQVGLRLSCLREWTNFAVGDWLNYGEIHYGETYAQAASETHIPEDRLMILKYVSSRVAAKTRIAGVQWSFHREVAKLEADEQTGWLARCKLHGWTLQQLKDELTASGLRRPPPDFGKALAREYEQAEDLLHAPQCFTCNKPGEVEVVYCRECFEKQKGERA